MVRPLRDLSTPTTPFKINVHINLLEDDITHVTREDVALDTVNKWITLVDGPQSLNKQKNYSIFSGVKELVQ